MLQVPESTAKKHDYKNGHGYKEEGLREKHANCHDSRSIPIKSRNHNNRGYRIRYTKRDSEEYIQAICGDFGWDAKVKEHFMIDQNAKSKNIHLLLRLKNCGHMMEPVRAEQLNSTHSPQLPDIGI